MLKNCKIVREGHPEPSISNPSLAPLLPKSPSRLSRKPSKSQLNQIRHTNQPQRQTCTVGRLDTAAANPMASLEKGNDLTGKNISKRQSCLNKSLQRHAPIQTDILQFDVGP